MFPLARRKDLVVRELPEETLVYDVPRHRAHCLNRTAAQVWRHCDGSRDVGDLAALLPSELPMPAAEELVFLALQQFRKAHLLEGDVPLPVQPEWYSRRRMLAKLGIALAMLPAVISVTAPKARAAASMVLPPSGPVSGPQPVHVSGSVSSSSTTGTPGPTGPSKPSP